MGKTIVDYRGVNLAWLIGFKAKVFDKSLAPDVELVVAQEDGTGEGSFEFRKGDTMRIVERTGNTYVLTKPYGVVLKGEVPSSAVEPKAREQWTTEDVVEYVIKPACQKEQCTYLEVLKREKNVVAKKKYKGAFISQARKCRFSDLVDALKYFHTLSRVDLSKQYVWLDIFSANQPKLTAKHVEPAVRKANEYELVKGLHIAIKKFDARVMFLDKWDNPTALTRAWCVWEIFGMAKAQKKLQIALPEREYDRYLDMLVTDYKQVMTSLASIDVTNGECFSKTDLQMIQNAIRAESSFEELNDIVLSQLRGWVAVTAGVQVDVEEAKPNPDIHRIVLLASCAGLIFQEQGYLQFAEHLFRKALNILPNDPHGTKADINSAMSNLASVLETQGKVDEAKLLYEEAIRVARKEMGNEDPSVAHGLSSLGHLLHSLGRLDEALEVGREALAIRRKVFGDEHYKVAESLNNLAAALLDQGKLEEAEAPMRESLGIFRKLLGDEHPDVAVLLNNLAELLRKQGKREEAKAMGLKAYEIARRVYGENHPNTQNHRFWVTF